MPIQTDVHDHVIQMTRYTVRHSREMVRIAAGVLALLWAGNATAQAPSRAVVVEGHVRQAGSETPLAGVTLMWFDSNPGQVVAQTAKTGDDGSYRITVMTRLAVYLRARAAGHIAARKTVLLSVDEEAARIDFELALSDSLSGVIVDSLGNPVAGAAVWIVYPGEEATAIHGEMGGVVTDQEGRFHQRYVKQTGDFVLEVVSADGHTGLSSRLNARGSALHDIVVPVEFKPGITLTGRVLDESGRPVARAGVKVTFPADHRIEPGIASVAHSKSVRGGSLQMETDENGSFRFDNLPPSSFFHFLVAHRSGRYEPYRRTFMPVTDFQGSELTITLKSK